MPAPQGTPKFELTEDGEASILGFVEDYVAGGLGDLNYAVTDLPGFIADPGPVNPAGLFPKTVLRQACRSYARGDGPQNLPGFDGIWGGICEPYLDSIGELPTPGTIGPPFTGGQCYTAYSYIYSFRNPNTGQNQDSNQTVTGRIIGLFEEVNSGGFTKSGGIERQQVPGGPITRIPLGTTNAGAPLNQSIRNVQRIDGQPDNCGNPPVLVDPPKVKPGLPVLTPVPITIPGFGTTPVNVTFNPDGTINVNLPDVGIEVPIEVPFSYDGGGDGEPGGGGGDGPPPGDVGEPGSPVTTGAGGEEEGEAPEGSELVGLRLELLEEPLSRTKYTDLVRRGACYIYMGVPGLLDHDPAGAMLTPDQFVFAEREGLTAWRVRANTGYSFRITPYYREVT